MEMSQKIALYHIGPVQHLLVVVTLHASASALHIFAVCGKYIVDLLVFIGNVLPVVDDSYHVDNACNGQ